MPCLGQAKLKKVIQSRIIDKTGTNAVRKQINMTNTVRKYGDKQEQILLENMEINRNKYV